MTEIEFLFIQIVSISVAFTIGRYHGRKLDEKKQSELVQPEVLPPEKDCCFECKERIKYQTCRACNDTFCKECYPEHDCD